MAYTLGGVHVEMVPCDGGVDHQCQLEKVVHGIEVDLNGFHGKY